MLLYHNLNLKQRHNKMLLDIKNIYLQNRAKSFSRTQEILNKYPTARVIPVPSHWNIPQLNKNESLLKKWNKVKKEYLIVGVKSGLTFKENGRSTDFISPSIANGCAMACNYCYVARRKGYANPVTVFANIEEIKGSIVSHSKTLGLKRTPNQCDSKYWTYDIGCNNDVSVDALISDNVKDIVALFKTLPNAKATFATKYVNLDMLNYDPQRKTRIRFSLLPEFISKKVDVRCSPVHKRIQAINSFYEAGYEVHLNFSPVIIYSGWKDDYADMFKALDILLTPAVKKQLACEVIFLTHNAELHELNKVWHPKGESFLWSPATQEPKTSLYGGNNLRYKWQLKKTYIEEFKQILKQHMPYINIRYIF